jgi:hypothetical protein
LPLHFSKVDLQADSVDEQTYPTGSSQYLAASDSLHTFKPALRFEWVEHLRLAGRTAVKTILRSFVETVLLPTLFAGHDPVLDDVSFSSFHAGSY